MSDLVGLQGQPVDMMGKLSQLLQVRAQQQALAGQAAQVQQEQQTARQRAAIAKYDWNKHIGDDGTIDVESVASDPELAGIAGDSYLDVMTHVAQAKQQQLTQKSTLLGLRTEQRKAFADMMTSLRSDKDVAEDTEAGRQKVNEEMIRFGQVYGADTLPILQAYAPGLQKVPQGRMADALRAIGLQAASADKQIEMQQPQYVSTGRELANVNPLSPGAAPSQPTIPLSVGPGQQDTVGTDQLGNQYRVIRDARGNVVGTAPMSSSGPNGPAHFEVGERDTFEKQANTNFENVTSNRSAASMAPQQLDQINKALDLSKDVSTGAWASKKANIESGIGSLIPGFEGFDNASKLQELDKFAERIATDASKVLGVNAKTDAERESIHKQNANIGYTPQAIQSVLKYAKAQTLAMEAKGNAQEAWLESGNKITKQHEFETKFRQAYDPRVFQFEVMSPGEQETYLKKLSKEDRKSLREKTNALIELGAIDGG